jgi:hypothetical protein
MNYRAVVIGLAIGLSVAGAGVGLWAQGRGVNIPTGQIEEDRYKVLGHEFTVFSGDDVGIRVVGQKDANGRVPGTLVVKMNGQWVDVVTPAMVATPGR